MRMRKLNNKGFTLIELLAVVVILAVVMGIAMTSVLSAMNNSRKGSLQDSATSVSRAFQTKYSEDMVNGNTSSVYGDVLGTGYDFSTASKDSPVIYLIAESLKDELNISPSTYELDSSNSVTSVSTSSPVTSSFVAYNGSSFVVCMIAKSTGSYYVANAASAATEIEVLNSKITIGPKKEGDSVMYACSKDATNSWTNSKSDTDESGTDESGT